MPSHRHSLIAREGWPFILLISAIALFLLQFFSVSLSIPVWLLLVVSIYLFRDPQRNIPASPLAVVSPVSGKVEKICELEDRWIGQDSIKIRIRMGYNTPFTMRSPVEGKVIDHWYSDSALLEDEKVRQHSIHIRTDEHDDVLSVINISSLVSRLRCYSHPGERIGQGQRCGYLFFGGTVDVYLPESSRVGLKEGDEVISGESVLGHLIHKDAPLTTPVLA